MRSVPVKTPREASSRGTDGPPAEPSERRPPTAMLDWDGRERLADPREPARVGRHHPNEPEVPWAPVKV